MSNSLQELHKAMEQGDFLTWMLDMDYPIMSIMESFQNEKQIMVDPLSLKDSHFSTKHAMLPTIVTNSAATSLFQPPPIQPPKERFLSMSLPNSANSSPRFGSALSKKKSKSGSPEPQCEASNFDNIKLQNMLQEVQLGKSKSCGEGRSYSPFEEFVSFDHWLKKPSAVEQVKLHHDGKFSKTHEAVKGSPKSSKSIKHMKTPSEDGLKCSALCLYLPGFGGNKVKPVKTRKEESKKEAVMSRTVSLENFECGSWASAAMFHEIEGDSINNYYFDLPIELMKYNSSASEACSPVKGVLKNSSSRGSARKSDITSPRPHVRFSTSTSSGSYPTSPATCITPRLRKARDDFNAFLSAAQTA